MLRRNGAGPETVESVRRGGGKFRVEMTSSPLTWLAKLNYSQYFILPVSTS